MIQQSPTEERAREIILGKAEQCDRLAEVARWPACFEYRAKAQAYRDALDLFALASQASQPAEADGWVMVPRVMTGEMRKVFHDRVRILVTPAKRECEITNDQELWELVLAATPKAPATDAGEVEITARQRSPIVADYGENYLVARVSNDGKLVGIDHPCDAVWSDVMVAHVALRDYINERIARQDACPFKAKALAATPKAPATDAGEVERLAHVIDRDRYAAAACVNAIEDVLRSRGWLREAGRGSYAYDDERYQQEFGLAFDEIMEALRPMRALSKDKSDCTRDEEKVKAARIAGAEKFAALATPPAPNDDLRAAERQRIIGEARRNLALTQGCMECNGEDERRWQETIEWLEKLA